MPTNNQEKWEIELERMKPEIVCIEKFTNKELSLFRSLIDFIWVAQKKALKSFIRQEIRQAKIEALKQGQAIAVLFKGNEMLTEFQKEISNLKNNDKPTRN